MATTRKTLTKKDIETMAYAIMKQLIKHYADEDVCIYFNNCKITTSGKDEIRFIIEDEGYDPHDYFKYAAYDHILSMSFEGRLYDIIDSNGIPNYIQKIFDKYGVCSELGNMWNLTCFPQDDNMKIEYTKYEKPKEVIRLYMRGCKDEVFKNIMDTWYNLSKEVGDVGSCVLGAGFKFTYNNSPYFMSACSPWQGSISWETHKDTIAKLLGDAGCTDISYDWGTMN